MKKDYFEEKKKRLEQKIKLLINKPAFQEDVNEFRKFWEIPLGGLKEEKESQKWNRQFEANTVKYYLKNWPEERKEIIRLRKQKMFREAEEIRERISVNAPFNILKSDVWKVIRKYRISPRWYNGIRRYILFNDFGKMEDTLGMKANMNWDYGILKISLEIDEDTTLADLKHAWSWVRKMYKNKQLDKFQPIKNFDRDKRIYDLKEEGKTTNEIEKIINFEYADGLSPSEIKQIIKRQIIRFNIN